MLSITVGIYWELIDFAQIKTCIDSLMRTDKKLNRKIQLNTPNRIYVFLNIFTRPIKKTQV